METRKDFFRDRNHASMFMDSLQHATGLYAPGSKPPRLGTDEKIKHAKNVRQSIQAFVGHVDAVKKAKAQAMITTTVLPAVVTDTFDKLTDVTNWDGDYMRAFKDASSYIAPGNDYWEVAVMQQGSTWIAIPEGEKVNVRTVSGTLDRIYVGKWGDAIGWTDEAIRFRKIGVIAGLAEDFRNGYARVKADTHYNLLASSSGATQAAATTLANNLENDILTLNNAAYNLLNGLRNTRNVSTNTELLLYLSPSAQTRINRALGEVSQAFSGSTRRVTYNITPIYSFNSNLPAATVATGFDGLLVLPGYQNQSATLMEPTFFSDQDILTLSYIQSGFSYWGAGCLDTAQIRRVSFEAQD